MAKGQLKTGRDKKKPKQDNSAKPLSAYKQSMAGNTAPTLLGKKK